MEVGKVHITFGQRIVGGKVIDYYKNNFNNINFVVSIDIKKIHSKLKFKNTHFNYYFYDIIFST